MEEVKELDGKALFKDIMKRAWIIVLCTIIFAVAFLVYNVLLQQEMLLQLAATISQLSRLH